MIEPGDINDKDILDNSKLEKASNGTIRFKYMLPNGSELVSEYFNPDHRREAIKAWLEAVRSAVTEVIKGKAAEKGRAAREAAMRAERDAQMQPAREQDTECKPPQKVADEDPVAHARNQVALLDGEVKHWTDESQRAARHLRTAQDKLRKWKQIVASFEAGEEDK